MKHSPPIYFRVGHSDLPILLPEVVKSHSDAAPKRWLMNLQRPQERDQSLTILNPEFQPKLVALERGRSVARR
jgi:hypothetical protein